MHINHLFFYLIAFLGFGILGCFGGEDRDIPSVDHISVALEVDRFDQDFLAFTKDSTMEAYQDLKQAYPDFFEPVFLGRMLPMLQDSVSFLHFSQAQPIRNLFDTCSLVFNDFSLYEKDLEQAFQFYKYYFHERDIPRIITFASEYTYGNFTLGEEILGIGLDFFLGEDHKGYPPQIFPRYVQRRMTPEHLVSRSMQTLLGEIMPPQSGDRMLDYMIHNGKVLYFLDHLLPHTPDSIKLGYTQEQVEWVNDNELDMWSFFLAEELLYYTQFKEFRKYVEASPDSPGMPDQAPGRTANWIGWQIVKQYMEKNPNITMEGLLKQESAQVLFTKAKYKPRR
ncbi:MAG: hypothetical protein HKN16_08985 [Saprospiraceae bacterium]|nr:hypothetical protein [Saprospiraceae bacterium]